MYSTALNIVKYSYHNEKTYQININPTEKKLWKTFEMEVI